MLPINFLPVKTVMILIGMQNNDWENEISIIYLQKAKE